ncbi:tryptophan synthase subunit alpha [Blattabacterium cuenoti]|uniref:tryptophan synthase subunit alpha n=1 Tax=Blattabacterium cuenoti TaxID=1653831 RepID=UPI00163C53B3|nr:tryptophan synthase subunit alpha [Blattabacterium cuenoti]
MNKIHTLFNIKKNILCIYFTAGYPTIDSIEKILLSLQDHPYVDLIEIGLPYSDPLADGIVIQNSNQISLKNGMNITLLFLIIKKIKNKIKKPIIIMGYYNQFYKFGEEKFLKKCKKIGVSGLIFPDMPVSIFIKKYKKIFKKYLLSMIFLITPKTDKNRILQLSKITDGFLYLVSSNSVTGKNIFFGKEQILFFKKIQKLSLRIPKLIGFGIRDKKTFELACQYANGGIIGSSFIQSLNEKTLKKCIIKYINSIIL